MYIFNWHDELWDCSYSIDWTLHELENCMNINWWVNELGIL